MGGCHSACGSRAYELEYYNEAYRHQTRQRARAKLVDETLAGDNSGRKLRGKQRAARRHAGGAGRPTRLWMCEQGCCSIRWKLDYAEFQSYTVYAQVSPYVVVQDKTGRCGCVICRGCAESPGGNQHAHPAVLSKACAAQRLNADALTELLPSADASSPPPPSSSPLLVSDVSTTDATTDDDDNDDDDDDGSI